jgi:NADPH-dependent 7-cyano-7-deazaguanine reductase QueF
VVLENHLHLVASAPELPDVMKSFKMYMTAYRNVGIFYENAVNRILRDVVKTCHPVSAKVTGVFNTRGGMRSVIDAEYARPSTPSSSR